MTPILGALKRPARRLRAVPSDLAAAAVRRGARPVAVFLPARGPSDGAARLRIYAMARALRPRGWTTLVVPWRLTLDDRRRLIARAGADVVVMQSPRHPLNDPGLYSGVPVVVDMDDADFHLPHLESAVKAALPGASLLIAGSRYVAETGLTLGVPRARVVWTGGPISRTPRPPQRGRGPVIAWAQSRPMTYRAEAGWVRRLTRAVARHHPGTVLRLYDRLPGDDPAFAESFSAPGLTVDWRPRLDFASYVRSFDDVALGLAPLASETPFSRGKSFGKALTYLDRHVPVIATPDGEHPRFFTPSTGVLEEDPERAARCAVDLLKDAPRRTGMAEAAFEAFRSRLSTDAAADRVAALLEDVLAHCGNPGKIGRARV